MADPQTLEILGRGVEVWNKWRSDNPAVKLDLSEAQLRNAGLSFVDMHGADLRGAELHYAQLSGADLHGADLRGAGLSGAELSHAKLVGAKLSYANLNTADVRHADLSRAKLSRARLGGANLHAANLDGADLRNADLNNTDLSGSHLYSADLSFANLRGASCHDTDVNRAIAYRTIFADIDFRGVVGLETIQHRGPSEISVGAIRRSEGSIPEVFLRGCGLKNWEIETTKLYRRDLSRDQIIDLTYKIAGLRSDPLIQFNSCFISYSSKDEEFAKRLYSDLQGRGVRCWFAPEDMKIGDRIRKRIDNSIQLYDKLLLVLSETSIASQWIEQEVETALEKEREQRCNVLFPIRLDDTVWREQSGWPSLISKTRHIGDFSHWKDIDDYQKAFRRLLNDLRVEFRGVT